eukprot:8737843-Pyramimonas_sp.AAC.1
MIHGRPTIQIGESTCAVAFTRVKDIHWQAACVGRYMTESMLRSWHGGAGTAGYDCDLADVGTENVFIPAKGANNDVLDFKNLCWQPSLTKTVPAPAAEPPAAEASDPVEEGRRVRRGGCQDQRRPEALRVLGRSPSRE